MKGIVYLILNMKNGKKYVGQTKKTVEKRFKEHAKTDSAIGNAIRKYGAENFRYGVIKRCDTKEELDKWEKFFIDALKTKAPTGYNRTDGGDGVVGWTDDMRARVSAANKGKKRSPEAHANMSAAQTERFKDPAERAKLSASKTGEKHPFFGKHHTPQHCANISAALTGKVRSPEHCANISKSKKGKHPTDETRDNMSESRSGEKNHNFGKPRETETCTKISEKNRAESLYKNLVAELESRQMSYSALAKLMDLNPATISEKMRGRKNFTDSQISKLVEIFGKPAEYLLQRDEECILKPVTDTRKSPFKNLIAEMDARQLSYPALAELIGSTKQSASKKIRGERSFKESEKNKLAEIFGKPIEYLLKRDE